MCNLDARVSITNLSIIIDLLCRDLPASGQLSAQLAALLLELHLQKLRLPFIRRASGGAINLTVSFSRGYRYIIAFRESTGILGTMHAKVDDVTSDKQQGAIIATHLAWSGKKNLRSM